MDGYGRASVHRAGSMTVACPALSRTAAVTNPYTLVRAAGHEPGRHASLPSFLSGV